MTDTPRTVRDVLEEIAEGRGPFSRDHLTHAANCIERSKELAAEGIALLDGFPEGQLVRVTIEALEPEDTCHD